MALATRPKPTTQHKKRRAQHHRHSKTYVKAYWPYLPMLAIVGVGAFVNKLWSTGALTAANHGLGPQLTSAQPLTRVQVLTDNQTGSLLAIVLVITAAAFAVFVGRHWYRLHRLINKGEAFVSSRPWLDIVTVLVFTAGVVLTRPNGLIS